MSSIPTSGQQRLYFGNVEIVESLPPGDMKTGWNLHEELEPICVMAEPHVICRYSKVFDRAEFNATLQRVLDDTIATGRTPILQIETHGNSDGIGLASGEFVSWPEMRVLVTAINKATRLNLFVLLAACDGANMVQVVQPTERAAVLALIGPKRVMCPDELQRATITFYRTLFQTRDAPTAWRAMNAVIDPSKTTFAVFSAEFNFKYIFHHFLMDLCTEDALLEREARIETEARLEGKPEWFITQQRPVLKAFLRNHQAHFEATKSHYFFCDLFPENASRFPVSSDECRELPVTK